MGEAPGDRSVGHRGSRASVRCQGCALGPGEEPGGARTKDRAGGNKEKSPKEERPQAPSCPQRTISDQAPKTSKSC